jgi:hypothetical protein
LNIVFFIISFSGSLRSTTVRAIEGVEVGEDMDTLAIPGL